MSYSNKFWDKFQASVNKIKQLGLASIMIVIVASIVVNIKKQTESLNYARKENEELALNIAKQEFVNNRYRKILEYAEEQPYYWEQQARDKLGIGGENDYWVNIDQDLNLDLYPEINYQENKPNWIKWLEVFTK